MQALIDRRLRCIMWSRGQRGATHSHWAQRAVNKLQRYIHDPDQQFLHHSKIRYRNRLFNVVRRSSWFRRSPVEPPKSTQKFTNFFSPHLVPTSDTPSFAKGTLGIEKSLNLNSSSDHQRKMVHLVWFLIVKSVVYTVCLKQSLLIRYSVE